jgi:hypothetical protein
MNRIYQGKVSTVETPNGKNGWPPRVQPPETKKGLRFAPTPVQELRFRSQPDLVADRLKKSGAAKAPFGSHRPALRRKRLGSSQPIVAARLVLIRDFRMNKSTENRWSWKEAGRGLASPRKVCELRVLMCGSRHRPFRRF